MLDGGKTAVEISRKLARLFQALYSGVRRMYRRLRVELPKTKGK